jgi:hypothetical protein
LQSVSAAGTGGKEAMTALGKILKRRVLLTFLAVIAPVCSIGWVLGAGFNEHDARGTKSDLDKKNVWVLDFRFKAPRLIKVDIPGRGTRICWYLWYQVINNPPPQGSGSKEPVTFAPDFELVTQDTDNPAVYDDEILPKVQDAINKIENPSGADYLMAKNSVTIAATPIPPSKPDAFPTAITGVAIWDGTSADPKNRDPKKKDLADSNRYSIFVSGLSNGWVLTDPPSGQKNAQPVVRRKTLQLNFKRLGDRFLMDSREISYVPPAEWLYRASSILIKNQEKK